MRRYGSSSGGSGWERFMSNVCMVDRFSSCKRQIAAAAAAAAGRAKAVRLHQNITSNDALSVWLC
jgi:hypothetical protein